jgi:hypothetical protein
VVAQLLQRGDGRQHASRLHAGMNTQHMFNLTGVHIESTRLEERVRGITACVVDSQFTHRTRLGWKRRWQAAAAQRLRQFMLLQLLSRNRRITGQHCCLCMRLSSLAACLLASELHAVAACHTLDPARSRRVALDSRKCSYSCRCSSLSRHTTTSTTCTQARGSNSCFSVQ